MVLLSGLAALTPPPAHAQFNPPRVMLVVNKHNPGNLSEDVASKRSCYIDRGREASIKRGDELNVYRELPHGQSGTGGTGAGRDDEDQGFAGGFGQWDFYAP